MADGITKSSSPNVIKKKVIVEYRLDATKAKGDLYKFTNAFKGLETNVKKGTKAIGVLNTTAKSMNSTLQRGAMYVKSYITMRAIGMLSKYSDSATILHSRLKLVTTDQKEILSLQDRLFDSSRRVRGSYEAMGKIFVDLQTKAKAMNLTNAQALEISEGLMMSFRLVGATEQQTSTTLMQTMQGLQSNNLAGDELRTIRESNFLMVEALQKVLGEVKGISPTLVDIKEEGAQGNITAKVQLRAWGMLKNNLQSDFDKLSITFAQMGTMISSSFIKKMDEIQRSPLYRKFMEVLQALMPKLESILKATIAGATASGVLSSVDKYGVRPVRKALRGAQVVTTAHATGALGKEMWGMLASKYKGTSSEIMEQAIKAKDATLFGKKAELDKALVLMKKGTSASGKVTLVLTTLVTLLKDKILFALNALLNPFVALTVAVAALTYKLSENAREDKSLKPSAPTRNDIMMDILKDNPFIDMFTRGVKELYKWSESFIIGLSSVLSTWVRFIDRLPNFLGEAGLTFAKIFTNLLIGGLAGAFGKYLPFLSDGEKYIKEAKSISDAFSEKFKKGLTSDESKKGPMEIALNEWTSWGKAIWSEHEATLASKAVSEAKLKALASSIHIGEKKSIPLEVKPENSVGVKPYLENTSETAEAFFDFANQQYLLQGLLRDMSTDYDAVNMELDYSISKLATSIQKIMHPLSIISGYTLENKANDPSLFTINLESSIIDKMLATQQYFTQGTLTPTASVGWDYTNSVQLVEKDIRKTEETIASLDRGLAIYMNSLGTYMEGISKTITGAFKQMEDAFTSYLKTGKWDMHSFVDYVLDQMARLTVQKKVMPVLEGLFEDVIGNLSGINIGGGKTNYRSASDLTDSFTGGAIMNSTPGLFSGASPYSDVSFPSVDYSPRQVSREGTKIQVINNSTAKVETETSTDSNGMERIRFLIVDTVKGAMGSGELDSSMKVNYNTTRPGVR